MTNKINKINKETQSGFTILIAVIVAGILLIIVMSIGGIALKEQLLATANKDSQVAYYAADAAMECVLYWDQKRGAFGPDASGGPLPASERINILCNNVLGGTPNIVATREDDASVPHGNKYSYVFKMPGILVDGGPATTCAVVTITKDTNDPNICPVNDLACITKTHTIVSSRGYNTCDPSLRRVERGVTGTY